MLCFAAGLYWNGKPILYTHVLEALSCLPLLTRRDEAYTGCLHGILEAEVESVDDSVVNAAAAGLAPGAALPRGGERVSLTVRRVLHTYSVGIRL